MRTWLYGLLESSNALDAYVEDRIWQNTALEHVPEIKPFVVYRFGARTSPMRGDDSVAIYTQSIQVFAHDTPGDYVRIEEILAVIHTILIPSTHPSVTWLEDSEDLRDDDFGTILKWSRYQINYTA